MPDPFFARSASDRTDDWPFWFVARRSNPRLNVLREACSVAGVPIPPGVVLTDQGSAEIIANEANIAEAPDA